MYIYKKIYTKNVYKKCIYTKNEYIQKMNIYKK